ncbi:hypothetical protein K461DRAFT_289575 [Myriangium duriaei CBS 260.36]|uniref:Uncharacterized protein n=1 Tax=Myriangium duriaei CBS 260.36 TaxID=1168546 RepID=A0A9P4J951_9PEZI|nr:hypothetical protein K461DRAFT_289575 [Myriangium duriaei CBS 260.36]
MCYYDVLVFTCGDYRWDKFRGRCPREHRMGETCGTKMLYSQIASAAKCKYCQKIDVKLRKRQFELNRYNRWVAEGSKLRASMELSLQTIAELDAEIQRLTAQRQPFRR